jgi:hypothetical protein
MHATRYWVQSFVVLTPIDLLLVHETKVVAITSRCMFLANMIYNLLSRDMLYLINNKFLAWKFSRMPQKDLSNLDNNSNPTISLNNIRNASIVSFHEYDFSLKQNLVIREANFANPNF